MDAATTVAEETWNAYARCDRRPGPPRPMLAIFVGVPLSGKTSIARAFAAAATTRTCHIGNDALRPRIVAAMDRAAPEYDAVENLLTYRTAWTLIDRALGGGTNAIHDATSLTEGGRRGAYDVAEARDARTLVVFVQTSREVLEARAETVSASRQEGYAKLGRRQPDPAECSQPSIVLDGARPVAANVDHLSADVRSAPLFTMVA